MTAADLLASEGHAFAHCPRCKAWRRIRLRRLFPTERQQPLARIGRQLRCAVCEQAPDELAIRDAYRNRATFRLS